MEIDPPQWIGCEKEKKREKKREKRRKHHSEGYKYDSYNNYNLITPRRGLKSQSCLYN
jgi:hypothetical protein